MVYVEGNTYVNKYEDKDGHQKEALNISQRKYNLSFRPNCLAQTRGAGNYFFAAKGRLSSRSRRFGSPG